jgi:DNA repair exonuclease SbcCD ATPase subunit
MEENQVVWSADTNAVKPYSQLGQATEQLPNMNRHQRRANVAMSIKYKKEQLKLLKQKMEKLQKLSETIKGEAGQVQELNNQIKPVIDAAAELQQLKTKIISQLEAISEVLTEDQRNEVRYFLSSSGPGFSIVDAINHLKTDTEASGALLTHILNTSV